MNDVANRTWHVSRRVGLPLGTSAVALDAMWRPHVVNASDDATLELRPIPVGPGAFVARRLEGTVRLSRVSRPVRIEVELSAWSRADSEIAIRPAGTRPPHRRADRYFTVVVDALARLHEQLLSAASTGEKAPRLRRAS